MNANQQKDSWTARWRAFRTGFARPLHGAVFLLRNRRLWPAAVLPFITTALVYLAMAAIFCTWLFSGDDTATSAATQAAAPDAGAAAAGWLARSFAWLATWGHAAVAWIAAGAYFAGRILALAAMVVAMYATFPMVGMIIAGPFNELLSEQTETLLGGRETRLGWRATVRAMAATTWDALQCAVRQLVVIVLLLPLCLIPGVGVVAYFLANAYFLGMGLVSISLARHYFTTPHRRAGLAGRRWEVLGLGVGAALVNLIPLGGVLLPFGVIAATQFFVEIPWDARFRDAHIAPPRGWQE